MADKELIAAMQRQAAEAEVERLRLVEQLDAMRERAEQAEARLASVSGVTREQLVAAEREACARVADYNDEPALAAAIRERGALAKARTCTRFVDARHVEVLKEGLKAAVELLDCSQGVPCRPDLDDKVRSALKAVTP